MVGLADEVTEAMVEFFFIAIFGQEIAGGGIDGRKRNAGADDGLGFFVGLADKVVNLGKFWVSRLSDYEGTGHVGAVALINTSHIDEHAFAVFYGRVIGFVVWVGGIGANGDNGRETRP